MKKTIMTVDDSASIRQMVALSLTDSGFEVIQASDGQEALNKMQGADVQLLLTDLNVPVMNGLELIKRVRSSPEFKFLPILMLTTESQDAMKQAGRAAGATGWLVKPFNQDQLLSVVKRVLG